LNLDNLDRIAKIDTKNMLESINRFPEHIEEIIEKVQKSDIVSLSLTDLSPNKVVILGMGGSAISGDILEAWCNDLTNICIKTVRDYSIPEFVDKNTLVFVCSYSGNTEETLSSVKEAISRKARIIGITSGGKIKKLCEEYHAPVITIPSGLAPRAAMAYLFFPIVVILEKLNKITLKTELPDMIFDIKYLKDSLKPEIPTENNEAKKIALELSNGIPFIYGHTYLNVIAYRWKTQLNENAKVIAMSGEIPEMHHNEIVGWSGDNQEIAKRFVVVLFRSEDEHPRVTKRLDLTKKMLKAMTANVLEVQAKGSSRLSRMISTMYLGDYISVYLALLRELDPTPVIPIERFKKLMKD
jgi:glucose/mannose-6-phosphate isomerase